MKRGLSRRYLTLSRDGTDSLSTNVCTKPLVVGNRDVRNTPRHAFFSSESLSPLCRSYTVYADPGVEEYDSGFEAREEM